MSEQKIDQNATVANVQKNEDAVVKQNLQKRKSGGVCPLYYG